MGRCSECGRDGDAERMPDVLDIGVGTTHDGFESVFMELPGRGLTYFSPGEARAIAASLIKQADLAAAAAKPLPDKFTMEVRS